VLDVDFSDHLDPLGPNGKPAAQRRTPSGDPDQHGAGIVHRHPQVIDRIDLKIRTGGQIGSDHANHRNHDGAGWSMQLDRQHRLPIRRTGLRRATDNRTAAIHGRHHAWQFRLSGDAGWCLPSSSPSAISYRVSR
jgi:hypothetical protein